MGDTQEITAPAFSSTAGTVSTAGTARATPAALWLFTVLAAIFLWFPVSGIGGGLASVPHTGRGCDAGSGPICGNQAEALWASVMFAAVIVVLYLGAVVIVAVEHRGRTRSLRAWPPLLALAGYVAALFLGSYLLGRS
ncbi:hypothetical protein QFZ52_002613 [Arthrobacter woluwensis]|uniref:hypothetical protein n=1 Tax=Arthrobacter woluwensis TaxID=156980 RepID=UPI0027843427|nr:hypothetical protein [Arthrobacter woluwensis]MDQ0709961.1 hypothetical protein [Arthrobacter woluwensis]